MTKQMLLDLVKQLKKRNKVLIIAVAVLVALFVGMTIFAFSEFDISVETKTEYDIKQDAELDGENSIISQENEIERTIESDKTAVICGTVIVCIGILTAGVVIYGKRKSTHKDFNKEKQKIDD